MKIGVCSDLHLEFGELKIPNDSGVDVLILSGDILVENDLDIYNQRQYELGFMRGKSRQYHDFFHSVCADYTHVIYIAGNHEHYHGDFATTIKGLKSKLSVYKNLHILDKETFELGDYVFYGSTLWTDMNRNDPLTLEYIRHSMNDFRIIVNSNHKTYRKVPLYERDSKGNYVKDDKGSMIQSGMKMREEDSKFSPKDAMDDHVKSIAALEISYDNMDVSKTMVVVGHHTPTHKSCHPRYANQDLMNGGYHSNLSEFILDRPRIKLWTHGHTHDDFDYMVGDTRVVCNPRGYIGHEPRASNFKLKVIEL